MIFQIENAVNAKDCRCLMEMYDRYAQLSTEKDYTGHPVVSWSDFRNGAGARELFQLLIRKCLREIAGALEVAANLFPETVVLATMGPGGYHPRHADNCRQDESGNWEPNHTPCRTVSAIYYLNNDFDGGELVFEQHELTIKPHGGLLVFFPSDKHHVHEVRPVRSGHRYTAAIWFTNQQSCRLADFQTPREWLGRRALSIICRPFGLHWQ
jgi:hypothetical protein